jgi:hypothetical protein
MAEPPTSFTQQEILAPVELTKGMLTYVAKKNPAVLYTRCPRRFKKGTGIRPASVSDMGGHYTTGTQRVDMLD